MAWTVVLFIFLLASGLGIIMLVQGACLWMKSREGKGYIAGGLVLTAPLALLGSAWTYFTIYPIHWG